MTLTVAEIERWDAGDVREVFHAASDRAQAARDAANGIATLPALATWGGVAAAAAKAAVGKTRRDLDAHGREALVVANAARGAAEEIERIKSELATLRGDAAALGLVVDAVSGRVVAGAGFKGTSGELLEKQQKLQPRVDKLVVQANLVDLSLANAIKMADGTTPIPNLWRRRCQRPPFRPAPRPGQCQRRGKTWCCRPMQQDRAAPAHLLLSDTLFQPGGGADPASMPNSLDEALFPPGDPQPASGTEPAGSAEPAASCGSPAIRATPGHR